MSQVTISSVRERLACLEDLNARGVGTAVAQQQFELACLRLLLASMDSAQEPVAWTSERAMDAVAFGNTSMIGPKSIVGEVELYAAPQPLTDAERIELQEYRKAQPTPVAMKDHQIRELVNELRDIAVEYHGTQQIRARIAKTVNTAMLKAGNSLVIPDCWVACSERMPEKKSSVLISVNFDSDLIEPLICSARWTGSTFRIGEATVKPGNGIEEATHWMPLPAAPQQEVKEKK